MRIWISMAHHPGQNLSAPAGEGSPDEAVPAPVAGEAPAEPAVERSRFSQWLASFGLGELQDPLLTRGRPPAPRRPGS
jgi:hypothetical protein